MDNTYSTSKTLLLCVSGCIAAYKACDIVRMFQKAGVRVRVLMTRNATEFVGKATFEALTREPVYLDLFDNADNPIPHIAAAQDCDACLIAPCTANLIAKIAQGIADDLVTSTVLACTKPLLIAPAMNTNMYESDATQTNMHILHESGVRFIEPTTGKLACGDVGKGHLAEIDDIVDACLEEMGLSDDYFGKRVLVTAGPTREPIDAVRYISNRSSGKMGYAIAEQAVLRGAHVTLVSGPVSLPVPAGVKYVGVETAEAMLRETSAAFLRTDVLVCCAAVSDMRPKYPSKSKLKKGRDDLSLIQLEENPDILATLAAKKGPHCITVGFAAETDDLLMNAQRKLESKHADVIVANCVRDGGVFGSEENEVIIVTHDGDTMLSSMPKPDVANKILDVALEMLDR